MQVATLVHFTDITEVVNVFQEKVTELTEIGNIQEINNGKGRKEKS